MALLLLLSSSNPRLPENKSRFSGGRSPEHLSSFVGAHRPVEKASTRWHVPHYLHRADCSPLCSLLVFTPPRPPRSETVPRGSPSRGYRLQETDAHTPAACIPQTHPAAHNGRGAWRAAQGPRPCAPETPQPAFPNCRIALPR